MKKYTLGLAGLLLAFSFSAHAIVFTETYTYSGAGDFDNSSTLTEGEMLNFGFDMENAGGLGTTPASFSLTEDSVGAVSETDFWKSGSLEIVLYSVDQEAEVTNLWVTAYNGSTLDTLVLDAFAWSRDNVADPYYTGIYTFSKDDLAVFHDWGWANVNISAAATPFGINDFAVSSVSFSVVPEPASLALMGLGLVGLGFAARRKAA